METLRAGPMTATVDPRVGATITDLRVDGEPVLWSQPAIRDPKEVLDARPEASMEAWVRGGVGGWEVMAPNAGDAGTRPDGRFVPFHGAAGRAPWEVTTRGDDELHAFVVLDDLGVRVSRHVRVSPEACLVTESLTNVWDVPVAVAWGSHLGLGQSLLTDRFSIIVEGEVLTATIDGADVPPDRFSSLLDNPTRGTAALGFVALDDDTGHARLVSEHRQASVRWNATTFPYLWVWIELEASAWPWGRSARAVGLEPVSSWPATGVGDVIETTRTHVDVNPGNTTTGWVELTIEERTP